MTHYNGFNYEEFHEFIIDFFESDQTPEGKVASKELYDWWNVYVPYSTLMMFAVANTPQASVPKLSCYSSSLAHLGRAVVNRGPTRTASAGPLVPRTLLVSFRNSHYVCLVSINTIDFHRTR